MGNNDETSSTIPWIKEVRPEYNAFAKVLKREEEHTNKITCSTWLLHK